MCVRVCVRACVCAGVRACKVTCSPVSHSPHTVLRAIGIPARPITNFESAHDSDSNRAIDYFYDKDDNIVEEKSGDSIWLGLGGERGEKGGREGGWEEGRKGGKGGGGWE